MPGRPFHPIGPSPWPLTSAVGALSLAMGIVMWMNRLSPHLVFMGVLLLAMSMTQWWRDILREGDMGYHTSYMMQGFRDGMVLFLVSEGMFFFSFFWAFFHSSLAPAIQIGCQWPPLGIQTLNPYSIPLANTAVLLSSGATLTYGHYGILSDDRRSALHGMIVTIGLGCLFTVLQMYEYYWASFTIADSVYGSLFYVMTGFHGLHVIVGTVFLVVTLWRLWAGHFRPNRHFGFEACSWYWHFVDVVWVLLYIWLYIWGS